MSALRSTTMFSRVLPVDVTFGDARSIGAGAPSSCPSSATLQRLLEITPTAPVVFGGVTDALR